MPRSCSAPATADTFGPQVSSLGFKGLELRGFRFEVSVLGFGVLVDLSLHCYRKKSFYWP